MADTTVEALVLDLLEWVATRERSYADVMDAWRTSCPKLPVWEEANDRGLVSMEHINGSAIEITERDAHVNVLALLDQRKLPKSTQHDKQHR